MHGSCLTELCHWFQRSMSQMKMGHFAPTWSSFSFMQIHSFI
jgi:hypothetical protein